MGNKRFKDQILAQILKACEGEGKSKTKVVYASGLNFKTIMPYLITLNKNGLIEIIPGEYPLYKITQKGEDALAHLRALEELAPEFVHAEIETPEFASPGADHGPALQMRGLEGLKNGRGRLACARVRAHVGAAPPGRALAAALRKQCPLPWPLHRAEKESVCCEFTFSSYYSNNFSALRYSDG